MSLPAEETISSLADVDQPLLDTRLAELSNLTSEELESFTGGWSDIEPERRCQIIYRLVDLAENNIEMNFDDIFKHLLADQDDDVRSKAIEGFWENEESSLVEPLLTMLEKDSSEKVQLAAAVALAKFAMLAEQAKLPAGQTSRIKESLLAMLADKSRLPEVRARVLEAVAPLSFPQVKIAIMEAFHGDDPELKVSAIFAMGRNCDLDWLPLLLNELESSDAELRYEAAGACAELEAEEAVFPLIQLVDDSDADVQMAAIRALGKIGNSQAKEYLERFLDSASQLLREEVEEALQALNVEDDRLFSEFKGD